jgi:hypothetical protein
MNTPVNKLTCQCWFLLALAGLCALPLKGSAQGIIFNQLPPSPSLGLVQDTNGNWVDPLAAYDSQGLRLLGTSQTSATYNLVLNGQVAYTFIANGSSFSIDPSGTNKVIGGYLDNAGATGAAPLANGYAIGPNAGTAGIWLGYDPVLGGLLLSSVMGSGEVGSPTLWNGPFAGLASGYIGLEFYTDGQPYYGWVRIGAPVSIGGLGWVYDYGYSSIPNTTLFAGEGEVPEPSTWALLIFGSLVFSKRVLSHWR